MSLRSRARKLILLVDGFGLVLYCYWLATRGERVFYHSEGVFYLLPCIPLIFVFAYVWRDHVPPPEEKED